ncbi:hypothetical protein SAMN05443270_0426 [Lacrimispora sphenoides]|uniref:hypothetical protein n=1 Tax=Lacrimispora sphenoides TaxID=29370 RepID=UPI0008CCD4E4|nr:hypothetical protein [Lacrimispora sphenoides]SET54206.1 hypothetical protein SAMN05443270_0426 [Lacrimispora sphenoides]
MNYEKSMIRKKEWLFFVPFFAISLLSGKLVSLNNITKSDSLNKAVIGLEWLFCIMLIAAAIYGIYKLIKKDYTLEKMWLFTGIFILLQFVCVYQFELLLKYYNIVLNNVVFHDIMASHMFSALYVIFLTYYVIKSKNSKTKNGLSKVDIMVLFLLLLPTFLRSINLYILREVLEGARSQGLTIITQAFFTEDMRYSEKADIAEKIMDHLMLRNTYIDLLFSILMYGTICVGGIALFREKITYQKYLALGGTFIIVQYLGITYFDKMLNCFNNSFYTANINILYHIVLNYSYPLFYIIPLVLYSVKKIYSHRVVKNEG